MKPNYRSLGPRFGKEMPQVAAAVEALDAAAVARGARDAARRSASSIDGKDHTLSADDINLVMEPLEGYQVEAEAGHAVALELDLDDELRREGLAREVVRAVQEARKQAGLEVSDRIALALGGDEELLAAAREHEAYIAGETLATSVDYGADGAGREGDHRGPGAADRRQQGLSGRTRSIFDLDGVLVDSEAVWDDVRKRFVEENGGHWHDGAQRDMMGMSSVEWSRYVRDRLGVDMDPERISREVADRRRGGLPREAARCCPVPWRRSRRSPPNGRSASPPRRTGT